VNHRAILAPTRVKVADREPGQAWRTWLGTTAIVSGPVFRRVDRHDRVLGPLSPQGVALVVKRHMGRLGHTSGDFAGHSLAMAVRGPDVPQLLQLAPDARCSAMIARPRLLALS